MKKAVSMFLAAALAVGTFAGCGSSADTGSTGAAKINGERFHRQRAKRWKRI